MKRLPLSPLLVSNWALFETYQGLAAANPWYVSNNAQLLTNSGESGKRFILFKLFLPKSKSLNLGFLLKNWL